MFKPQKAFKGAYAQVGAKDAQMQREQKIKTPIFSWRAQTKVRKTNTTSQLLLA